MCTQRILADTRAAKSSNTATVKFSFERVIDPANHALNAPDMGILSHVEVHDRYAGTLVLHSPYAAIILVAGNPAEDIRVLENVRFVMMNGKIVKSVGTDTPLAGIL